MINSQPPPETHIPHPEPSGWPALAFSDWKDTLATLQLWTQIVGKIRLRKMPWMNHSWHVTLYVTPQGLTTGSIPYDKGLFQLDFDFIHHQLLLSTSTGTHQAIPLYARTVASFYRELMDSLQAAGIEVVIYARPNEVELAIPFSEDNIHQSYDGAKVYTFWQALVRVQAVFTRFRAGFTGKCSPVHFFWGGFDLAVTRFSGRAAPKHPGGAPHMSVRVMQEAYSHEVSSCGFWPGSEQFPQPVFYAYCYPTPEDFAKQPIAPKEAFFSPELGEFLLAYQVVQESPSPEATLMEFLQSTYEAAANTGNWDRRALECDFSSYER